MLGPQLLRQAEAIVEEWVACSVSTEPADRPAAERAISELYRGRGWPAPGFVWVDSPLGGEVAVWILGRKPYGPDRGRRSLREVLSMPSWERIGPGFLDSVLGSAGQALGDELRLDEPPAQHLYSGELPDMWASGPSRMPFERWLLNLPDPPRSAAARAHVASEPLVLGEAVHGAYLSQVRRADREVLDELFSLSPSLPLADLLSQAIYRAFDQVGARFMWSSDPFSALGSAGAFAARWVGRYDMYRRLGLVRYPREIDAILDLHVAATRACGDWSPYQRLCVITERPIRFEVDWPRRYEPRPHSATGPALAWRDGWDIYAWRGIGVSRELVDGNVTITDWRREPNAAVRRAILERMGYEWLLDSGTARKVAADEYGTLWRIFDRYSPAGVVVVELVNPTPEPDGSFKRYVLRVPPDQTVPRDAIGWTLGLRPGEYPPPTTT